MASPFHPPRFNLWTNQLPKSQKQKPLEANMGRQNCKLSGNKNRRKPIWDAKVAKQIDKDRKPKWRKQSDQLCFAFVLDQLQSAKIHEYTWSCDVWKPVSCHGHWSVLEWIGMDWSGLDWNGQSKMDWTGVDWSGLDWRGLAWSGLDWSRRSKMDRTGVDEQKVRKENLQNRRKKKRSGSKSLDTNP